MTRHHTTAGLVERIEHQVEPGTDYVEWRLDGEEISVDTAADILAREVPAP